MDVLKGDKRINRTYTRDRLQLDSEGLTTCHVCSNPHSLLILVKRERLWKISRCLFYPFGDKAWVVCLYVCAIKNSLLLLSKLIDIRKIIFSTIIQHRAKDMLNLTKYFLRYYPPPDSTFNCNLYFIRTFLRVCKHKKVFLIRFDDKS
jgi:hypothetical protein